MASPACSDVWWPEWCEGDRLFGNRRIALGCAGTENPLPPAISPPLSNVFDLGAVPMEKTVPVVDSLDVLRRRADRLTKRWTSPTRLRYALAPESGPSMKDKPAGLWDDRPERWSVVIQSAPLAHDCLSKWNQQRKDLADSRTELGSIRVTLPSGVSTCEVRRCCAIILQHQTEELVPFLLPTITPGWFARCFGQPDQE